MGSPAFQQQASPGPISVSVSSSITVSRPSRSGTGIRPRGFANAVCDDGRPGCSTSNAAPNWVSPPASVSVAGSQMSAAEVVGAGVARDRLGDGDVVLAEHGHRGMPPAGAVAAGAGVGAVGGAGVELVDLGIMHPVGRAPGCRRSGRSRAPRTVHHMVAVGDPGRPAAGVAGAEPCSPASSTTAGLAVEHVEEFVLFLVPVPVRGAGPASGSRRRRRTGVRPPVSE